MHNDITQINNTERCVVYNSRLAQRLAKLGIAWDTMKPDRDNPKKVIFYYDKKYEQTIKQEAIKFKNDRKKELDG